MKPEDYFMPRYKVLIPYPGSDYEVGEILCLTNLNSDEYYFSLDDGQVLEWESFYKSYPEIFKLLKWHEERKPEDMPQYVSYISLTRKERIYGRAETSDDGFYKARVFQKVERWEVCGRFSWSIRKEMHYFVEGLIYPQAIYRSTLPATEEEYNNYINSIKK